jgi:hypothetical protein
MPSTIYTAISAAAIRIGSLARDCWKTCAVPWKVPWMEPGTPISVMVRLMAATPVLSAIPGARLKEMVLAAKSP